MGVADHTLRIDLLGEVRVRVGDQEVAVGPPRQRAVLAILALRAGETVSRADLVDGVWGDAPPASVEGSVHTYIHGLRRVLSGAGSDALVRAGAGYRLLLDPSAVDVAAAESATRQARELAAAGHGRAASELLENCLALWRGAPLSGVPGPLAEAERKRLTELRFQIVEERAELMLAAGRHRELIGELEEAVEAEPFRERLRALLMLALYRSGRRTDALGEFEATRQLFAAELGLDLGPELSGLQTQILRSDPVLDGAGQPAVHQAPAQLPHEVPGFVGREGELEQLARWRTTADAAHTLVISAFDGIGGIGKTSLAVRFARQVADEYPDGQLYLNLRGFDPHRPPLPASEALGQLLWSLGAAGHQQDREAQLTLYRTFLSRRRMLILLDNAESAEQIRDLLPGPSRNLVLITSRNKLSGLPSAGGTHRLTLGVLSEAEALDLLRAAAGSARIDAEPGEAAALVRLCGYLPLAVRIAAEKISSNPETSLRELVAVLTDERGRLKALQADDDEMSSVRGVFSWSYHSLAPALARTFRYLGMLPGSSIDVRATAALLDRSHTEAAASLQGLYEQNLLEKNDDRFEFHDLVRVYAVELADRYETAGDRATAMRRLLDWYLNALRSANRHMMPDESLLPVDRQVTPRNVPEFVSRDEAYAWCQAESANIRALTEYAADVGEHTLAWQLPWYMFNHYYSAGLLTEWIDVLTVAFASAEKEDDPLPRVRILNQISIAHSRMGRNDTAVRHLEQALEIVRETGKARLQIPVLVNLSSSLREMKRYERAITYAREAVRLALESGTDFHKAGSFDALCELLVESGRPDEALDYGKAGLESARTVEADLLEANLLVNVGHAQRDLGYLEAAARDYQAALELCVRLGDRYHEALALFGLAELHRRGRATAKARDLACRALDIFVDLGGEEAGEARKFLVDLDAEVD